MTMENKQTHALNSFFYDWVNTLSSSQHILPFLTVAVLKLSFSLHGIWRRVFMWHLLWFPIWTECLVLTSCHSTIFVENLTQAFNDKYANEWNCAHCLLKQVRYCSNLWCWHILSIPLTTGRGTSAETCGLDDVFPPDDLGSRPEALCWYICIYIYMYVHSLNEFCYRSYIQRERFSIGEAAPHHVL